MGHATLEITADIGKGLMPGCGAVVLVAEPEHSSASSAGRGGGGLPRVGGLDGGLTRPGLAGRSRLGNVVKRASLVVARRDRAAVERQERADAITRVVAGLEKGKRSWKVEG